MNGAFGSGVYKCEITAENPSFVTLELSKNITIIGKFLQIFDIPVTPYKFWLIVKSLFIFLNFSPTFERT